MTYLLHFYWSLDLGHILVQIPLQRRDIDRLTHGSSHDTFPNQVEFDILLVSAIDEMVATSIRSVYKTS